MSEPITDEQRLDFILQGYCSLKPQNGLNREEIDKQILIDDEWQAVWEDVKYVEDPITRRDDERPPYRQWYIAQQKESKRLAALLAEKSIDLEAALEREAALRKALAEEYPDLDGPETDWTPEVRAEQQAEWDEWIAAKNAKQAKLDSVPTLEAELAALRESHRDLLVALTNCKESMYDEMRNRELAEQAYATAGEEIARAEKLKEKA